MEALAQSHNDGSRLLVHDVDDSSASCQLGIDGQWAQQLHILLAMQHLKEPRVIREDSVNLILKFKSINYCVDFT